MALPWLEVAGHGLAQHQRDLERRAERLHPRRLVDRWPDAGEVMALARADVPVHHLAEVDRDADLQAVGERD